MLDHGEDPFSDLCKSLDDTACEAIDNLERHELSIAGFYHDIRLFCLNHDHCRTEIMHELHLNVPNNHDGTHPTQPEDVHIRRVPALSHSFGMAAPISDVYY